MHFVGQEGGRSYLINLYINIHLIRNKYFFLLKKAIHRKIIILNVVFIFPIKTDLCDDIAFITDIIILPPCYNCLPFLSSLIIVVNIGPY